MYYSLKNKVQLIGWVGKDPEIVKLEDGKKIAKFSLATKDVYTNGKGQKVEDTQWHHVCFWNGTAEIIEKYVFKGSEIAVEGKLTNRSWEDQSGVRHFYTEIIGAQLVLLGKTGNIAVPENH